MIYNKEFLNIKEFMPKVIENLEMRRNVNAKITGIESGFRDLDYMIEGLHKGELVVVGARPGMGKTSFVLNILLSVAMKGNIPAAIFSLDEGKESLIGRMLSMQSRVDRSKIRTGEMESEDWHKVMETSKMLSESPIYINDICGISVKEIREKSIELKEQSNIELIVIDYLQLINYTEEQNDYNSILQNISNLATDLNIPIILTSQLSRRPEEREDHTPRVSDFANIRAITDYADTILLLYRDDYYNAESEKKDICEVIIKNNMYGDRGIAELYWQGKYMKFSNLERVQL